MARAKKTVAKKEKAPDAKPDNSAAGASFAHFSAPPPSYPLSPSEIEIILHIRWNGKSFERSERAGKGAVLLTGEELIKHARGLPFDPARSKIENRSVEYDIQNEEDFSAMLPRSHRVQLVTVDGKIPETFEEGWISGRKGVKKPDGIGILLSRPML